MQRLTVLPKTRSEDAAFRSLVSREQVTWRLLWEKTDEDGEILDRYSVSEQPATSAEGYRLVWYHSQRKAVHRIQALLSMYFFVLLIEALLERELRGAMERNGIESLPLYPEGRPCCWPTARRLLGLFEPVLRHTLTRRSEPTGYRAASAGKENRNTPRAADGLLARALSPRAKSNISTATSESSKCKRVGRYAEVSR